MCDEGTEFESFTDISQDGCAKLAVPTKHEVDGFSRDEFGCADVVPFIFTIFIVEHDDNFALSDGVDGGLDRTEGSGHDAFRCWGEWRKKIGVWRLNRFSIGRCRESSQALLVDGRWEFVDPIGVANWARRRTDGIKERTEGEVRSSD